MPGCRTLVLVPKSEQMCFITMAPPYLGWRFSYLKYGLKPDFVYFILAIAIFQVF